MEQDSHDQIIGIRIEIPEVDRQYDLGHHSPDGAPENQADDRRDQGRSGRPAGEAASQTEGQAQYRAERTEDEGRIQRLGGPFGRAELLNLRATHETTRRAGHDDERRRAESGVDRLPDQPGGESRDETGNEGQTPNADQRRPPERTHAPGGRRAGRRVGFDTWHGFSSPRRTLTPDPCRPDWHGTGVRWDHPPRTL